MKSNKEKVYDFIKLHTTENSNEGIATQYIAEKLDMQRTNVSSILNKLVQEQRIEKSNGRPVRYRVYTEDSMAGMKEQPLKERFEQVQKFLQKEAAEAKRTLVVKGDLMRCLLLYEYDANTNQLEIDIKNGCANARAREYESKNEIQLLVGDFTNSVRKGFLRYHLYRDEIDKLVQFDQYFTFNGNKMQVVGTRAKEEVEVLEKPILLFVLYGEQVATGIVKTIKSMVQVDNVYAFELEYEKASLDTYQKLKAYIAEIHQGKGVIAVYDSCFLSEMLREMEEELNILIRQVQMPIITMGLELAKKAKTQSNIDEILQGSRKSMEAMGVYNRNYIVALCTTGQGGAVELKHYIERYGHLKNTDVIPLSVSDRKALEAAFEELMRKGAIRCVVGTFNPQLYSIPFISISEVFGTKKENLPKLLELEKEAKAKIDYFAMFDYLDEQLEYISVEKLKKILPETLKSINAEIAELSLDTEVGLLIHISCCIDRLVGNGKNTANPRKKAILTKYEKEMKKLLKILKPLERAFHIIINDDEIANILTIIFQI